ncbi:tetratricopeptide repeat protein [Neisseria iguanae]|uniref:Sel1 repeat family protein n=1 Tax=Neisseria iguanae TaxID=90242 RepID=A0A2P7TXJ4_9NEIS|nr:tetratricopeptide repeat protein [Neisseria iguanae]PSJ79440.1 sel1 repeat family protein [Neisseria iguanae]
MKWIPFLITGLALTACHASNQNTPPKNITESQARQQTNNLVDKGVQAYEQHHYAEAMTYFTQASAAGHMTAPRYIGMMYLNGYGVEKNARRAVAEFSKAAQWGDVTGQFWLGYCYEQGIGVEQERELALKWYQLSARQGDVYSAPAMTALGRLSESEDLQEAIAWYQKSAAVGDKESRVALKRLNVEL